MKIRNRKKSATTKVTCIKTVFFFVLVLLFLMNILYLLYHYLFIYNIKNLGLAHLDLLGYLRANPM